MIKRIAIVAGEASGDVLGSRLMASLRKLNPEIEFEGIGGPEMLAQGLNGFYPMEKLSVIGLFEVLKHLPELLKIRRDLINRWSAAPPDLMIGIDAPDFNLKLEATLHQQGIKTAHYVSPSVWAWRKKRVKKMHGKLDLMLTLFPFEADFYRQHGIPVAFVGHPLADDAPLKSDIGPAREKFALDPEHKVLAILPGSRSSEIKYLSSDFIKAAAILQREDPQLQLITPMVNAELERAFRLVIDETAPQLRIQIVQGRSREVMACADAILLASGTAVLEGMFVGRPMVAAGKLSALSFGLLQLTRAIKVKHITLPNNLAKRELVPELIQDDVTVDNLVKKVRHMLNLPAQEKTELLAWFTRLHQQLRRNASDTAARTLAEKFDLR